MRVGGVAGRVENIFCLQPLLALVAAKFSVTEVA